MFAGNCEKLWVLGSSIEHNYTGMLKDSLDEKKELSWVCAW